ncbi:hypothetical protein MMC13_006874 [Lambiella insularis]|nr:hypothetical protein [Lambiella insularis]
MSEAPEPHVLSCVAGIISAFKDGLAIVETVTQRRKARHGYPPSKYLQDSLAAGPPALEAQQKEGLKRFGNAFAAGDDTAIAHLKDIRINLQTRIIHDLYHAQDNDEITDFTGLITASDLGRVNAVKTLCELYVRLTAARPSPYSHRPSPPSLTGERRMRAFGTAAETRTHQIIGSNQQSSEMESEGRSNILSLEKASAGLEGHTLDSYETLPISAHFELPTGPQKRRKQSMFSKLSLRRSHDHEKFDVQNLAPSTPAFSTSNPDNSLANQWSEGSSTDSGIAMTATMTSPLSTDPFAGEEPNPWAEPPVESEENAEALGPPKRTTTYAPSKPTFAQAPLRRMTEPSKINNYGGFCKGAFELQAGLSSMKRRQEMGPLTSNPVFWACPSSKCAFSGTAYLRENEWVWDTRIHTSHGIQYRWSFLAKSHVQQGRVKNGIYNYKCIFCVLQNLDAPVIQKDAELLQHISRHRGEHLGEAILHRTLCINDRVATENDDFDINLVPFDAGAVDSQLNYQRIGSKREEPVPTRVAFSPNDYG